MRADAAPSAIAYWRGGGGIRHRAKAPTMRQTVVRTRRWPAPATLSSPCAHSSRGVCPPGSCKCMSNRVSACQQRAEEHQPDGTPSPAGTALLPIASLHSHCPVPVSGFPRHFPRRKGSTNSDWHHWLLGCRAVQSAAGGDRREGRDAVRGRADGRSIRWCVCVERVLRCCAHIPGALTRTATRPCASRQPACVLPAVVLPRAGDGGL